LLLHAWVLIFNTGVGLAAMAAGGIGFSAFSAAPPKPVEGAARSGGVISS
jgi:hypothetical protein